MLNKNNTCSLVIEGCDIFIIGEDGTFNCIKCLSGRVLSNNECLKCPEGCYSCYVENNNQTKCISCDPEYALINGKCQFCSRGCDNCIIEENNKTSCLSCSSHYALNPNKTCTYCPIYGCTKCKYNDINNNYECSKCYSIYSSTLNKQIFNYAFIKNTFQCLYNRDEKQMYLYGCLEAYYIEKNRYECLKCVEEFILIVDWRTCIELNKTNLSNYCLETAINIGNEAIIIFSCNKCNNKTVLITNSNNISNCYERTGNLSYCVKGIKTEYGELLCTECVSHAHLNLSS